MGKSKKRILHKGINDQIPKLSREEALEIVVRACNSKKVTEEIKDLILLFGISAEELLENGGEYEDAISLKTYLC